MILLLILDKTREELTQTHNALIATDPTNIRMDAYGSNYKKNL